MTLLVKDANTTVQPLSTELDGNGNLVPLHATASVSTQGVASPVGPQNPLPVINAAGAPASDGSGTVATGGSPQASASMREKPLPSLWLASFHLPSFRPPSFRLSSFRPPFWPRT